MKKEKTNRYLGYDYNKSRLVVSVDAKNEEEAITYLIKRKNV